MATVNCPSCQAPHQVKDPAAGGSITCKRCGARFAVGGEADEGHPKHAQGGAAHHHKASGNPAGIAIGLVVGAIGLVVVLLLMIGGREKPPTYKELQQRIGITVDPAQQPLEIQVDKLVANAGAFNQANPVGVYVYVYYRVQEGNAVLTVDRGAWENNGLARIRQITLQSE